VTFLKNISSNYVTISLRHSDFCSLFLLGGEKTRVGVSMKSYLMQRTDSPEDTIKCG